MVALCGHMGRCEILFCHLTVSVARGIYLTLRQCNPVYIILIIEKNCSLSHCNGDPALFHISKYVKQCRMAVNSLINCSFYRAMHFSAKRGIAIACRLSVCLSVCNVGEL